MIHTKPCTRPGCQGTCVALTAKRLVKRQFCCVRCAALDRYAHGAKPPQMTPAQRRAAGRKGGLRAGETRRRRAIERIVADISKLVPVALRHDLDRCGLKRWQAVLARAYKAGRTAERSRLRMQKATAA